MIAYMDIQLRLNGKTINLKVYDVKETYKKAINYNNCNNSRLFIIRILFD